jgi:hypothetical protein
MNVIFKITVILSFKMKMKIDGAKRLLGEKSNWKDLVNDFFDHPSRLKITHFIYAFESDVKVFTIISTRCNRNNK